MNQQSMGSSPLARGTPGGRVPQLHTRGLIPARAGNTGGYASSILMRWAHPRSRGEHQAKYLANPLVAGSSPLARGTQAADYRPVLSLGLIPARAGNTLSFRAWGLVVGAHPRSRGEHSAVSVTARWQTGSSPLARGTRYRRVTYPAASGLIPARAGNTARALPRAGHPRAHPRSRGEHVTAVAVVAAPRGSSPLARGTLSGFSGISLL